MDLAALQPRLQQALGQEFTVGPLLGEGGFAAVFRSRDNVLNRESSAMITMRSRRCVSSRRADGLSGRRADRQSVLRRIIAVQRGS